MCRLWGLPLPAIICHTNVDSMRCRGNAGFGMKWMVGGTALDAIITTSKGNKCSCQLVNETHKGAKGRTNTHTAAAVQMIVWSGYPSVRRQRPCSSLSSSAERTVTRNYQMGDSCQVVCLQNGYKQPAMVLYRSFPMLSSVQIFENLINCLYLRNQTASVFRRLSC